MASLILLGTGAAVTDPHRTTTMLAFEDGGRSILVDCGGDVVQRALQAGLDLGGIDALVITHEHPDHVSGFPLFVEKLWLAGRRRPIDVYGIPQAISQAQRMFATFDTSRWNLPELRWHEFPAEEGALVYEDERFHITASPGIHSVPVVGLRVTYRSSGAVIAYSCDTERSDVITRMARGAHLLVHEANGSMKGHTTAEDAARVAKDAGVDQLVLVHLPAGLNGRDLAAARNLVPGARLGDELDRIAVATLLNGRAG